MSKILDKYYQLKKLNKDKLYLFKCGKFYIFIADDCDTIRNYVVLKKVKFTNDVYKCGFPGNSLDEYLKIFNNIGINFEIIDNIENSQNDEFIVKKFNKVKEYLDKIDVEKITPVEALNKIAIIKEMITSG